MTTIAIELAEDGTGTIAIDGGEAVPFESAEQVCSAIETLAGQPDADESMPDGGEAAAFGEATANTEPQPMMAPRQKPQMGARGMGGM